MVKELIDDELWSLIEPLLPAREPRNRRYAGRKPTPDRAILTGSVFVLRCVESAAPGDGLRFGHRLLATTGRMAESAGLAKYARDAIGGAASSRTSSTVLQFALPCVRGKRGRPLRKPKIVQGDRGYSSDAHRRRLRERGITHLLARLRAPHGSGLGKTRRAVERSIAWLHSFRRLKICYERYAHIHEAFLACLFHDLLDSTKAV